MADLIRVGDRWGDIRQRINRRAAAGPVSVHEFGALGNGSTNDTVALQTAIDSGEPLWFPPGQYVTTEPLSYANNLSLHAAVGTARISGNFAGPLLHSRGIVLEPDAYEPVGDPNAVARVNIDLRGLNFHNPNDLGCCVQFCQLRAPAMITGCRFDTRYRGLLLLGNNFGTLIQGCWFAGQWARRTLDNWDWGKAWGLVLSGHATAVECQITSNGTGAMLYGTQSNLIGGRVEVNGIGLRLGGVSISPGFGGQRWALSRSIIQGISMESNFRNLWLDAMGETVTVQSIAVHGGTNGPAPRGEYGILVTKGGAVSNTFQSMRAHGVYSRAAVVYEDAGAARIAGIEAFNSEGPAVEGG